MLLKVIGTGSKGNTYILDGKNEALILDTGCRMKDVLKAIDYNVSKICGVLITHEHGDHAKYAAEYEKIGIPVFKPYEHFEPLVQYGSFRIQPFELVHDVPCYGFFVTQKEIGNVAYLTDTEYCKYRFPKLNQIIVECNYDKRLIPDDHVARSHILKGHLELQTTKAFILANKTAHLRNVVLVHTSAENMDMGVMEREIKEVCGDRVKVSVAKAGMEPIKIDRFPF